MADQPRQSTQPIASEPVCADPNGYRSVAFWLVSSLILLCGDSFGQTSVPFPSTSPPPSYPVSPGATGFTTPAPPPTYPTSPGATGFATPAPPPTFTPSPAPSALTPSPTFNPYAPAPAAASPYSANPYAPAFRDSTAPMAGLPPGSIPLGPAPAGSYPYGMPPSAFAAPAYPSSVYPNSQPPVMFPGTPPNPYSFYGYPPGPYPPSNNWWTTTTTAVQTQAEQTIRLCQGARFRTTYLPGTTNFSNPGPTDFGSTDFEFSLVFACPRFFGSSQPLYFIPSYTQTLWDGPSAPGADLPGNAFGGFMDMSWETDPAQTFGAELGVRVGVFSSFDAISSESIRVPVKALGRLRLTPNSTARLGVYYLDRNKIKLLPAGGILWVPNPDTRWDIFFPEPKLAHYLTTHGNKDVWWYITGYYGGGAWTIEDPSGADDRIDINDIRVMVGFECGRNDLLRQGFRNYFFEVGYAFERELVFVNNPVGELPLGESLVFRAGFGY